MIYAPDLISKILLRNLGNQLLPSLFLTIVYLERLGFTMQKMYMISLTADPTYRIGEVEWNGIHVLFLWYKNHMPQNGKTQRNFSADVIRVFSEDIGEYAYHKIIVADARDGMEYPMITLDGGKDPSYRGLLAHEIGHQWFYGMVGSNETYRAALDEGFTQFLTAWALNKIDGEFLATEPECKCL